MSMNEELKTLREHFGLSRRKIAVMLDCSEMAIWRWESGRVVRPHPFLENKLKFLIETLRKKEARDERR